MKEGIRKYKIQHEMDNLSEKIDITEINIARQRMYNKNFIGVNAEGLGFGNISIRLSMDIGLFLITGTQTGNKAVLTREDYSIITNYSFEEFFLESKGLTQPSSEALTHAAIYELFPNINAVIHIHNEKLWSYMIKKDYYCTSEVEYGSREMVDEVKRIYQDHSIGSGSVFAMKGHPEGIISFGKNLEIAEEWLTEVNRKLSGN